MATLDDKQKEFLVKALACYDTPSQVAAALKEHFGVAIDRRQVHEYDPEGSKGYKVAPRWKGLFYATRAKFNDQVSAVPIANQPMRLRALQRIFDKAEAMNNLPFAAQVLEQAAKEVSGGYSNVRKIQGGDAGAPPVGVEHSGGIALHSMTDEELERVARTGRA